MGMLKQVPRDFSESRTKQSFKDSTDINKIIRKAQKVGSLSHLVRHGAHYGDFSDVPDLLDAHKRIKAGQKIFDDLPSELRHEFGNQFKFFEYVNDPNNSDRLRELLPSIAAPGRQLPAVRRSTATEANPAIASAPIDPPAAAPAAETASEATAEAPPSSTT